jgi:hypothetical protein
MNGGSALRKAAAYTQNNTNTDKRIQTSMPQVGFEPTVLVFERAKTVHALDQSCSIVGPPPGTGPWHQLYRALVLQKTEFTGSRSDKS